MQNSRGGGLGALENKFSENFDTGAMEGGRRNHQSYSDISLLKEMVLLQTSKYKEVILILIKKQLEL